MFFGRIIREKGIGEIVEAAKKCPNWQFDIYGEGKQDYKITRGQGNKIRNNIKFFGTVAHQVIQEKIQEADLVILPSWSEGNSLAILEAAASARAIIATPVGQNQVIVSPNWIVPVGDHVLLSQKLKELEGRWDTLERAGIENQERVKKNYSFEKMIKAYEALLV